MEICIGFLRLPERNIANWGLKATQIYSLTILEARNPKSEGWQGHALSGTICPCCFHLLGTSGITWLEATS